MSPKKVEKEDEMVVEEIKAPSAPVVPVVEAKKITFKQFIAGKNVKPQHVSGLKAFIGNIEKLRTVQQWEDLLKGY